MIIETFTSEISSKYLSTETGGHASSQGKKNNNTITHHYRQTWIVTWVCKRLIIENLKFKPFIYIRGSIYGLVAVIIAIENLRKITLNPKKIMKHWKDNCN